MKALVILGVVHQVGSIFLALVLVESPESGDDDVARLLRRFLQEVVVDQESPDVKEVLSEPQSVFSSDLLDFFVRVDVFNPGG